MFGELSELWFTKPTISTKKRIFNYHDLKTFLFVYFRTFIDFIETLINEKTNYHQINHSLTKQRRRKTY
ncbi:hypothetical protein BpHYR1_022804 [Brachionus plicatilis]|uniref:Uncharacterized protein n=1 Tax=Brachionus plicatilis TaxID=10195 RepID=A0A3M7SYJ8_BRAPC|nr:hypothetical protein BpHYR1_022804 [Brachionus plicatilis]